MLQDLLLASLLVVLAGVLLSVGFIAFDHLAYLREHRKTMERWKEMQNGKHRGALAQNNGGAAGGANLGAGGAQAQQSAALAQYYAQRNAGPFSPSQLAQLAQAQQNYSAGLQAQAMQNFLAGGLLPAVYPGPVVPPHYPTTLMPERTIVVGEIVGWRCWIVLTPENVREMAGYYALGEWTELNAMIELPTIRSIAVNYIWGKDGHCTGDVSGGFGVHAFKNEGHVKDEYRSPHYAYGQVALWGDVIEHQVGWRGSEAKILSLEYHSERIEHTLHERYGVGAPKRN